MKSYYIIFVILLVICCESAFAQVDTKEAERQAEQIHKRATSDAIYVHEELKALYYQNIQIIELLKDMRQLLQQQLEEKE